MLVASLQLTFQNRFLPGLEFVTMALTTQNTTRYNTIYTMLYVCKFLSLCQHHAIVHHIHVYVRTYHPGQCYRPSVSINMSDVIRNWHDTIICRRTGGHIKGHITKI